MTIENWQEQQIAFSEWHSAIQNSRLQHYQLSPLSDVIEVFDETRRGQPKLARKNTVSYIELIDKLKQLGYNKEKPLMQFVQRTAKRYTVVKGL